MNVPPSADESEFLGDEAFAAGRLEDALDHYDDALRLHFEALDLAVSPEASDLGSAAAVNIAVERLTRKGQDIAAQLRPPQQALDEEAAGLRAEVDKSLEAGGIAHASHMSVLLGEALEELADSDGAESAYRQAVALARQIDAADPELMLYTFCSLIEFLPPSEESVALAGEMAHNLIERNEMYHPMRAAEAAYHWAVAELRFAELAPQRLDHAVDSVARTAIDAADAICFHEKSQALQRQVAEALRGVGRDAEADQWQAEADKYEDWEWFMDQQIPGHVHLWDIRPDSSAGVSCE